ncbi:MAG: DNRLRE domain-containing protein [bacterium]
MTNKLFLWFSVIVLTGKLSYAQLQANLNAAKDNTLYEDATGALSNGAGEDFFAGKTSPIAQQVLRRGLIAFDIAGNIPATAIIDSVRLRLSMSRTTSGPQPVQLRRVLADWGEGTSNISTGRGAPSTPNDATWIHSFFNTRFWTTAGGDFATVASGSQTVGSIGIYFWNSTPQMVADVQMWLNTPAGNFGWLVLGNENSPQTAKRFDSRENSNPANRPVLTVFYHTTTRVEDKNQNAPLTFHLAQNYPNPFNPETSIRYAITQPGKVKLSVYNLLGHKVLVVVD